LIAVLALYRPGPLESGMVDTYVSRKHGREKWTYEHPVLADVLNETYGVLVYQEQIMRILNRLGGIELSKSYAVIKAISKKLADKIDAAKVDFISGSQKQGLTKAGAEEIFSQIEKFARYGFNKSHTAAYAMIGYQTAYLKTHYTAEFMAALLSSEIEDSGKRDIMVEHIADARKLGVDVEPPNVNKGLSDFNVVDGRIIFGLTAIKGLRMRLFALGKRVGRSRTYSTSASGLTPELSSKPRLRKSFGPAAWTAWRRTSGPRCRRLWAGRIKPRKTSWPTVAVGRKTSSICSILSQKLHKKAA
jgi:DNA polymerase III alpha subunit